MGARDTASYQTERLVAVNGYGRPFTERLDEIALVTEKNVGSAQTLFQPTTGRSRRRPMKTV